MDEEARRVEAAGGWVGPARDGSLRVAGCIEVPRVFVKPWHARVCTRIYAHRTYLWGYMVDGWRACAFPSLARPSATGALAVAC